MQKRTLLRTLGFIVGVVGVILILIALLVRPGEQLAYAVVPFQNNVEDTIRKAGLPYTVEKAEPEKFESAKEKTATLVLPVNLGELLFDNLPSSGNTVIYKTFMKPEAGTNRPYDQPRHTYWVTGPEGGVLSRYHKVYTAPPSPLPHSVGVTYESVSDKDEEVTFEYLSWHTLGMGLSGVVMFFIALAFISLPSLFYSSSRQPSAQSQGPNG